MHDGFDEMATKFKEVRLTPTSFVLDKEGNIVRTIIGKIDFKELHSLFDQQLPTSQAKAI
jgi:protein-disulfide isomerase